MMKGIPAAGDSSSPFTLLVTGGRAATLEYYGQGETIVGPDTLTHTLYHEGTTPMGGLSVLTFSIMTSEQLPFCWHTCGLLFAAPRGSM